MDLGVILESPQGSQSSSRVGACTCAFLPSCSSSVTLTFAWIKGSVAFPRGFPTRLSHEAFPRGFPKGLSHVPPWCESILGLNVEEVRGKQVSVEWTETSGGLWEWWHVPGVPLAFPVESASSRHVTGTPGILSRPRRERIPPIELGGGIRAPLDVGGTLVLPLEWRRESRGNSSVAARL